MGTGHTDQAIGSAVSITTTAQGGSGASCGVSRLPLREFDLIYQCRVLNSLRAATVWA